MNALDDEPDSKGRYQRMVVGAVIAVALAAALVLGAQKVVPATRLLSAVVGITVLDEPPEPPKDETPPPPPEDLPKPEPRPQPKETPAPAVAAAPQPEAKPDQPQQESVGLDADSFGSGSGGGAFHQGTTQMGAPTGVGGGGPAVVEAPPAPRVAPRLVEAKPKPGNQQPPYTDRARRLAIQGLMVLEVDVDEDGRVTRTVVRSKLEPELDEIAEKTIAKWAFEPALLGGTAVASTKFIRLRFALN